MSKRERAARILGSPVARRVWSAAGGGARFLRILAYHRVLDDVPDAFPFDRTIVTATTWGFRRQMEFAGRNFDVLSFRDLDDCERAGRPWPRRALVITFDDGYRDNYTHAYPVLRELGLPATFFLVTGHVGRSRLTWWDLVAYCLLHTARPAVTLPEVSPAPLPLATREEKHVATRRMLDWIKTAPEEVKTDFLSMLPGRLEVAPPHEAERMHLSWDEAREMSRRGMEFGGHTVTHPVLSRVSGERLEEEVRRSKRDIEERLGAEALAFAYPVGEESSFGAEARHAVERAGFRYAVSNCAGTARPGRFERYALPRIPVESNQSHQLFRASLLFPRLMSR
jgi:peptidoglycan/xylan/chitin deacetylase (PgdA/CDA1 family)